MLGGLAGGFKNGRSTVCMYVCGASARRIAVAVEMQVPDEGFRPVRSLCGHWFKLGFGNGW